VNAHILVEVEELLVPLEVTQAKGGTDGGGKSRRVRAMRRRKRSGGWCKWGGGDVFLWCAGLSGFKTSADLLGSMCGMFFANAFSICGLTVLFGLAVSLLSVLLRCSMSLRLFDRIG